MPNSSRSASPHITVLELDELCPLDRFEPWLRIGAKLDVRRVWEQLDAFQTELADGLIVLGGRANALDDAASPWLPMVMRMLRRAVDADVPTLGICLGHQILAREFGGEVQAPAAGRDEEGAAEVVWSEQAVSDPLVGELARAGASIVAESHNDAVTRIPDGASLLASSARCAVQAMRIGSAVGVQFHPEVSPERMELWTNGHGGDGAAIRREMEAVDAQVALAGRRLAEQFLVAVAARAGTIG
ncbi:type 1 glutamine amidotransferase [uncultured Tessaracoccus sp.]|uniref:type 1 glutamine amidotransferase n=1 Tax=uncultured Tessaracoccus sp. TaxID=905023 RepID=UPI0026096316|nr:type 1 glutamine amidotransferase [uncultured Tessaracoccus sp.]